VSIAGDSRQDFDRKSLESSHRFDSTPPSDCLGEANRQVGRDSSGRSRLTCLPERRRSSLMKPHVILAAAVTLGAAAGCGVRTACGASKADILELLPYPQEVKLLGGRLLLGPTDRKSDAAPSETEQIAAQSLGRYLPKKGQPVTIRMGSVEEGYPQSWLTDEQRSFLAKAETSPEASVLTITPEGITVVGKGKWGMLYGVQTVNQPTAVGHGGDLPFRPRGKSATRFPASRSATGPMQSGGAWLRSWPGMPDGEAASRDTITATGASMSGSG
jgi:Glycosyl hydrolase family 20, domain 2